LSFNAISVLNFKMFLSFSRLHVFTMLCACHIYAKGQLLYVTS
jgi:hypothetical protein